MNLKTSFPYIAISLLAMAFATTASARSWRINQSTSQLPDFADINAACASEAVLDGDTLYLDPGCILSAMQNVTKRLTVIGCGYEGITQPYGFASITGALYMKAEGSKIMSTILTGAVNIAANYVTIERCRTSNGIQSSGSNCQYATIRQCYVSKYERTAISGYGKTDTRSMNWTIENCIINTWGSYSRAIVSLYNATIRNNILFSNYNTGSYGTLSSIGNSRIYNNVIMNTGNAAYAVYDTDTEQMNNNVISQNIRADYNRANVLTLDSIWTGGLQTYTLKEDSPAKGYGQDGQDCGIFGGIYPYVNGGRPFGHPYYTDFKVAFKPDENDKLKVSLNIKMQDE